MSKAFLKSKANSSIMGSPFIVLDGNATTKEILVETLHDKGDKKTGLKEFLSDLEETEQRAGNWWIAVDEHENPRGALTVRYIEGGQMCYLRSIWTRVLRTEDQYIANKLLLDAWMNSEEIKASVFQADLPLFSPLVESIEQAGFQKEKMLLASYDIETDWEVSDLPPGYIMRPVKREELPSIYIDLVEPDLDPASPIFVSEDGFLMFSQRVSVDVMDSWVAVENEEGRIVGFGASFLNRVPGDEEPKQAILLGPHSTEAEVLIAIIKEMSTYWKSRGIDDLRIMRVSEFYPSVVDSLDLDLINCTIRFIKSKQE